MYLGKVRYIIFVDVSNLLDKRSTGGPRPQLLCRFDVLCAFLQNIW